MIAAAGSRRSATLPGAERLARLSVEKVVELQGVFPTGLRLVEQAGGNIAMTRILAISGSLRRNSSNTSLLGAAALLAPEGIGIALYRGLGNLPHFNPDLEGVEAPEVLEYRSQLQEADGVLISSPEYAHGVPGVMKNALDWVVGSGELVNKPVALLNASSRSTHAHTSLVETLTVMSARVILEACITFPHWDKTLDAPAIASNAEISLLLRESLDELVRAIARD